MSVFTPKRNGMVSLDADGVRGKIAFFSSPDVSTEESTNNLRVAVIAFQDEREYSLESFRAAAYSSYVSRLLRHNRIHNEVFNIIRRNQVDSDLKLLELFDSIFQLITPFRCNCAGQLRYECKYFCLSGDRLEWNGFEDDSKLSTTTRSEMAHVPILTLDGSVSLEVEWLVKLLAMPLFREQLTDPSTPLTLMIVVPEQYQSAARRVLTVVRVIKWLLLRVQRSNDAASPAKGTSASSRLILDSIRNFRLDFTTVELLMGPVLSRPPDLTISRYVAACERKLARIWRRRGVDANGSSNSDGDYFRSPDTSTSGTIDDDDDDAGIPCQRLSRALLLFELLARNHRKPVALAVDTDRERDSQAQWTQVGDSALFAIYNYSRICAILARYNEGVTRGHYVSLLSIEAIPYDAWQALAGINLVQRLLASMDTLNRTLIAGDKKSISDGRIPKICTDLSVLSNAFSRYYGHNKILVPERTEGKAYSVMSHIHLLEAVKSLYVTCFSILGIEPVERM